MGHCVGSLELFSFPPGEFETKENGTGEISREREDEEEVVGSEWNRSSPRRSEIGDVDDASKKCPQLAE